MSLPVQFRRLAVCLVAILALIGVSAPAASAATHTVDAEHSVSLSLKSGRACQAKVKRHGPALGSAFVSVSDAVVGSDGIGSINVDATFRGLPPGDYYGVVLVASKHHGRIVACDGFRQPVTVQQNNDTVTVATGTPVPASTKSVTFQVAIVPAGREPRDSVLVTSWQQAKVRPAA